MRIAVLTSLYPGRERPVEGIFAERRWLGMAARGHEVSVVHPLPAAPPAWLARRVGRADWETIARSPRREERGPIAIECPRYLHVPGAPLASARRFARRGLAALEPRADVVVADYAWPASCAAPELARRGVPVVVSGRGSDVLAVREEPELRARLAENLRAAGHWCGVSRDLVAAMDELGGRAGQGVLVPNGCDLELFRPRERGAARGELGLPREGPLVIAVGHLIERKDPLLTLETFRRGAPAGARLVWIGRGPLEGALREAARAAGLADRVDLVGEVEPDHLALWYGAADAMVLCSRREGRPNVVIEALASGRPVLCTEAGGTAELLEDLPEMLVRGRDPGDLGAALARLLERPPDPGRLRAAVAHLSWEASLQALEACLERSRAQAGTA